MKTAFDHIDSRGKMHSSDWDRQQAESKYARDRDQQGKDLSAFAKYSAIQSARAAEAAEEQNALLAEQNKLLMMSPEERAAYKERLETLKRQEQRRKAELAAYWSSPAGVKARKLEEEQAKRAEEQARQESLRQLGKFLRIHLLCFIAIICGFFVLNMLNKTPMSFVEVLGIGAFFGVFSGGFVAFIIFRFLRRNE